MKTSLLYLASYVLAALVIAALLLAFLLVGEVEEPATAADEPGDAPAPAPAPGPTEFVLNAQGQLCRLCAYGARLVERPVSGRFTTTGQLLVRQ